MWGKLKIKVKYHNKELYPLEFIEGNKSNWIDLRAAETITMHAFQYRLISLGVSMELPKGYEAVIVPRSSTYKHYGIILTNHFGVIDNSYKGDNDIWRFPAIALSETTIYVNDRICQFRIQKIMKPVKFITVDRLGNANRGGHGSTGIR